MRTCKIYLMEKSELNLVFLLKKAPHLQCTTTAMYMYIVHVCCIWFQGEIFGDHQNYHLVWSSPGVRKAIWILLEHLVVVSAA